MILRPYQNELRAEVLTAFDWLSNRVLLVLVTGGGKTAVFTSILRDTPGIRWVVAHRQELVYQASATLTKFGIPHGVVKAGVPMDPTQQVQVASMQTLVRRVGSLPPPDLIICDEAHHAVSPSYARIFEAVPKARVLGVTATPCRLNGAGLGAVFDHMILGPTARWLTDHGFLCPAKYFGPPPKADLSGLPTRSGDYAREAAEEVMDKPTVTGDAVEHYRNLCDGVPMLVFCVSVEHAKHVAAEYVAAGYRAASVDGSMSDEERADRIQGLGTGKYQVITSCDLIGEGLDVPVVGAVQLLRPTKSLGLHLQQIGRGLRPSEGKSHCFVLDHIGNVGTHGFATSPRQWSLAGVAKDRKPKDKALRTCGECFLVHEASPTCPHCGYVYPIKERGLTRMEMVDGKLVEIEETAEERATALRSARTMPELMAFAKARGYKRPWFWARKVYDGRSYVSAMPDP